MDAAMAREVQTEAFDNFETSPYTETNAMQNGMEEQEQARLRRKKSGK